MYFYSHASCEARLEYYAGFNAKTAFLLTRLLRGATWSTDETESLYDISTHTPLARRDDLRVLSPKLALDFYSHASCEARHLRKISINALNAFLLTRLLRGATSDPERLKEKLTDFYSHASCEARRQVAHRIDELMQFLLTRLLRGATKCFLNTFQCCRISTHTPLARRDFRKLPFRSFYRLFLLTRLLRGATPSQAQGLSCREISTHTPLARRD